MLRKWGFISALICLQLAAGLANGSDQDCIDYAEHIHWSGIISTDDYVTRIAVSKDLAYMSVGELGMKIVDVSNLDSAEIVGGIETPGYAFSIDVSDDFAFIADGLHGVQIIRIKNSNQMRIVANLPTDDSARDVVVEGQYLYIADRQSGVHVVDVKQPHMPSILTTITTPDEAHSVCIRDNYLFIAGRSSGMHIMDIADPRSPEHVSSIEVDGYIYAISLAENTAYLGGSTSLFLVDIGDPKEPELLAEIPDTYRGRVVVRDGVAYVGAGYGMDIFDVSDRRHPLDLGHVRCRGSQTRDIHVVGQSLITATGVGLQIITAVGQQPAPLAGRSDDGVDDFMDVAVQGDYLYAVDTGFSPALSVYDISADDNRWAPRRIAMLAVPGFNIRLCIAGHYAYLGDLWDGISVVDIEDPYWPRSVAQFEIEDGTWAMAAAGDYLYVGTRSEGMVVVDVSSPENPVQVAALGGVEGAVTAIAVRGDRAYVRNRISGEIAFLVEIDIADPVNPSIAGAVEIPYSQFVPSSIALKGNYAYSSYLAPVDGVGGLCIIDISQPGSPRFVTDYDLQARSGHIAIQGDYAYVPGLGISVIDISNPECPVLTGRVQEFSFTNGVAIGEHAVYAANETYGLLAAYRQCSPYGATDVRIDIKPGNDLNAINCKGNPGVIPVAILTTDAFDALTVDHTTVRFGPGGAAESHVFKGPGPRGNSASSSRPVSGAPRRHEKDVDHDGDLDLLFHFARDETGIRCGDTEAVLTGQTYNGQSIIGTDAIRTVPGGDIEPEPDGQLQISPNPFNPSTSISFVVREPQHVRIGVYDVRGRLVAELIDEPYPAGRHSVEWRGRDTAGRAVPSGTYFFRVDLGSQVEVRKALLMK